MKETGSLHKKVQEMCDCYATSYPLKEMSDLPKDTDKDEAAAKWIALAVLHGVADNAEKIELIMEDKESVVVKATYRKSRLPSPDVKTAKKVFEMLEGITHLDDGEGKTMLALGIRDSSLDLKVKMRSKDKQKRIAIKFPD